MSNLTDYVYDFANIYGRYYHLGSHDEIMKNVNQLLKSPEEVLSEFKIELQAIKAVLELYEHKPCVGGVSELIQKI